jgi:membrane protease YdiL (CAAX protease family)
MTSDAWIVARAIGSGLLIAFAGIAPWVWLAPINARIYADWPWAGGVVAIWLLALIWWLNGSGPPRAWAALRKHALRLWRPQPNAWNGETLGLVAVIASIYIVWIVASSGQGTPDLSEYPTPAILISVLVMGAVVSGVVEEVAFRGYMQSQLERFGPATAIGVTSVVFALSHITHGLEALLLMMPGYLIASALYGLLAYRTGSILPGMALHVFGDMAHTFFAVLGGDVSLLLQSR